MIFQGQQPLLTIAEILFSDPVVILLDKATLDNENKTEKNTNTRSSLVG